MLVDAHTQGYTDTQISATTFPSYGKETHAHGYSDKQRNLTFLYKKSCKKSFLDCGRQRSQFLKISTSEGPWLEVRKKKKKGHYRYIFSIFSNFCFIVWKSPSKNQSLFQYLSTNIASKKEVYLIIWNRREAWRLRNILLL